MSKYIITIVNRKFLILTAVLGLLVASLIFSYKWVYQVGYKQGIEDVVTFFEQQQSNNNLLQRRDLMDNRLL